MKSSKLFGYTAGILATILMASLGIFVRHISADEQIITFARFAIGFLLTSLYLVFTGRANDLKKHHVSLPIICSGFFIAWCILSYIKAINTTSLANAVFLLYLGPLIATGLAAIFLQERLTKPKVILLGLALVGCLFILEFNLSFSWRDSPGYLWGILSASFYALFLIISRKISQAITVLTRCFYQLLFGAIAIIPFLAMSKINWAYIDWVWLIGVGFVHGFLALTLVNYAVKSLAVYEYGTISYLEPLITTLLGLFIYSETISPLQAIGCFIIFGVGIQQVFEASRKRGAVKH